MPARDPRAGRAPSCCSARFGGRFGRGCCWALRVLPVRCCPLCCCRACCCLGCCCLGCCCRVCCWELGCWRVGGGWGCCCWGCCRRGCCRGGASRVRVSRAWVSRAWVSRGWASRDRAWRGGAGPGRAGKMLCCGGWAGPGCSVRARGGTCPGCREEGGPPPRRRLPAVLERSAGPPGRGGRSSTDALLSPASGTATVTGYRRGCSGGASSPWVDARPLSGVAMTHSDCCGGITPGG